MQMSIEDSAFYLQCSIIVLLKFRPRTGSGLWTDLIQIYNKHKKTESMHLEIFTDLTLPHF